MAIEQKANGLPSVDNLTPIELERLYSQMGGKLYVDLSLRNNHKYCSHGYKV